MALYRPSILPLSLDVADLVYGATVFKQRVHQVDIFIPFGGQGNVRLDVYVSAYARTEEGGYGELLPADRVPVRKVPLVVTPAAAVTPDGIVRYRQRTPTLAVDAAGQEIALPAPEQGRPANQPWLNFLEAAPGTYVLQNEWLTEVQDTQQVNVREFVERFIGLADVAPSAFV